MRAASWCLLASFCCSTVVSVASAQTRGARADSGAAARARTARARAARARTARSRQRARTARARSPRTPARAAPAAPAPAPAPHGATPPPPPPNSPGTTDRLRRRATSRSGTPEPEIEKGDWDPWEHATADMHRHDGFFLRLRIGPATAAVGGDDHSLPDVDDVSSERVRLRQRRSASAARSSTT